MSVLGSHVVRDSHRLATRHNHESVGTRHWWAAFFLTSILQFPYFCFRTLVPHFCFCTSVSILLFPFFIVFTCPELAPQTQPFHSKVCTANAWIDLAVMWPIVLLLCVLLNINLKFHLGNICELSIFSADTNMNKEYISDAWLLIITLVFNTHA